jgi:hypothetical protein
VPSCYSHSTTGITLTKLDPFKNTFNTQFQDPLISGSSEAPISHILASAMFLLTVENLHNMNRVGSVSSGITFITNSVQTNQMVQSLFTKRTWWLHMLIYIKKKSKLHQDRRKWMNKETRWVTKHVPPSEHEHTLNLPQCKTLLKNMFPPSPPTKKTLYIYIYICEII